MASFRLAVCLDYGSGECIVRPHIVRGAYLLLLEVTDKDRIATHLVGTDIRRTVAIARI